MKGPILIICISILLLSCNDGGGRKETIFPKGDRAPAANFTGNVWLHPVVANDSSFHIVMGSVTFEPRARSNWHNQCGALARRFSRQQHDAYFCKSKHGKRNCYLVGTSNR